HNVDISQKHLRATDGIAIPVVFGETKCLRQPDDRSGNIPVDYMRQDGIRRNRAILQHASDNSSHSDLNAFLPQHFWSALASWHKSALIVRGPSALCLSHQNQSCPSSSRRKQRDSEGNEH